MGHLEVGGGDGVSEGCVCREALVVLPEKLLWPRDQGVGFRVEAWGLRVEGLGFRVQG